MRPVAVLVGLAGIPVRLVSSRLTLATSISCCCRAGLWFFVNASRNRTTLAYLEFLVGCFLILWNLMLSVNLRTKTVTRRVTYLICLVGSLWDEKSLYLAYIIVCLSFMASTIRLGLHVGATSPIACSVTGVTTHSLGIAQYFICKSTIYPCTLTFLVHFPPFFASVCDIFLTFIHFQNQHRESG